METITLPKVKKANKNYFSACKQFGDKSHELIIVNGAPMLLTIQYRELLTADWHFQINQFHDTLEIGRALEPNGNTYATRKQARDAAEAFIESL